MTGFAGLPHAQEEAEPPIVQLPSEVSNPSEKGNTEIGVMHCAAILLQRKQLHKNSITKIRFLLLHITKK
jgi:hypothetical protein